MTKRVDGKKTRMRLLNAAVEEFGTKGYVEAKVADICKRADANMASVNYYFNDKASLYTETWMHVIKHFDRYVSSYLRDDPPQMRLRQYVQLLLEGYGDDGPVRLFSRLYMMELVNPTGLIEDIWRKAIDPHRRVMHQIIREIIGREVDQKIIEFCVLSVFNQCRVLSITQPGDLEFFLEQPIDRKLINRLIEHITNFSLAGIMAVAQVPGGPAA